MSGSRVQHLQRRLGIFYLRVRVPDDIRSLVGLTEVRRSLHTYKPFRARTLCAVYAARVLGVFSMLKQREWTKEDARALLLWCFHDLVATVEDGWMPTSGEPDQERAYQRSVSNEAIADVRRQRETGDFGWLVVPETERTLAEADLRLNELPSERRTDMLDGVARAIIEQQRLFQLRMVDRFVPFAPIDPLFAGEGNFTHPAPVQHPLATAAAASGPLGPSLAEAIMEYLRVKKVEWAAKTYTARQRQLGYLIEHLGGDTPLVNLTSHDIRGFRDAIGRLRPNKGKVKINGFAKRQTDNPAHWIDGKTAVLIFEPTKAFFRWSKSEQGYTERNVAEDVRIAVPPKPKGQRSRRPFNTEELIKLFSSPLFTGCVSANRRLAPGKVIVKDARYWIPILGFYTGARLGELVQLHFADVNTMAAIPYIYINEDNAGSVGSDTAKHVKSHAGVRRVPLHPDLMALGFGEFVHQRRQAKRGSKRLFREIDFGADGQASTTFSKWFGRLMDMVGLKDPALVFHSFRHNAEDAFRNAGQQQYVIDRIIGHSDGATSAGYGEGIDLETAYAAVKAMKLKACLPEVLRPSA